MFDVMIARAAPGTGKTAVDLPDDVFAEQIRAGMNDGPGAGAVRPISPLVLWAGRGSRSASFAAAG